MCPSAEREKEICKEGRELVALPRKIKGGAQRCKDYTGPAYHGIVSSVPLLTIPSKASKAGRHLFNFASEHWLSNEWQEGRILLHLGYWPNGP